MEEAVPARGQDLSEEWLLITLSAAATMLLLARIWTISSYGFDYTDEGFYLNWIARPSAYAPSVTQFGFAYHPFYLLVDGDIANLRRLSFLATGLLAAALAWTWQGQVFPHSGWRPALRLAVAAAFGSLALLHATFHGQWMPGPSYNSLAVQGLLVGATGLLLVGAERPRHGQAGWILLAVGAWLAFLGKPTTGAAFGLVAGAALLLAGRFSLRGALAATGGFVALLLLTGLALDGSPAAFVRRYTEALAIGGPLDSSQTLGSLLRLEHLVPDRQAGAALLMLAAGSGVAALLAQWRPARWPTAGVLLAAITAGATVLAGLEHTPLGTVPVLWRGLLPLAPAAGVLALGLIRSGPAARRPWSIAAALLALPYAYALGTANNYWILIAGALIFAVLGGLALLQPLAGRPGFGSMVLATGLALQLTVLALVESAIAQPYRQPQSLRQNDVMVQVAGARLLLAPADAAYLQGAHAVASAAGWRAGMPMIDLSGASPGLLYALQARSVGVAWTLGGYPNSARFVLRSLAQVPCEQLAAAWVLDAPGGKRRLPAEVLASFGANPALDYRTVGQFVSTSQETQYLKKPQRPASEAQAACEAARAQGKQG